MMSAMVSAISSSARPNGDDLPERRASTTVAVGITTPESKSGPDPRSRRCSAEDCTKGSHEAIEVIFPEVAHHRDAEDRTVEFPLARVDHEAFVLEMRVERLVRFSLW